MSNNKVSTLIQSHFKTGSCNFCNIINTGNDIRGEKQKTLMETPNFIVVADLGAIVENYFLIISKAHINSMAELPMDVFKGELESISTYLRELMKKYTGVGAIGFEHGSGISNQEKASSSIKHAHRHSVGIKSLKPETMERIEKELTLGVPRLHLLDELKQKPYLSYDYGIGWGSYDFYTEIPAPSQFFRKIVAEEEGVKEHDWKNADDKTRALFKRNELASITNFENWILSEMKIAPMKNFVGKPIEYDARTLFFTDELEARTCTSVNESRLDMLNKQFLNRQDVIIPVLEQYKIKSKSDK